MSPEIIAELSCNHLGSIDRALTLVDAAADAGADAIKLQVWSTNRIVLDENYILPDGPWAGSNLAHLYREAHTKWDWVPILFARARSRGMDAFASVFDADALTFLEVCKCPRSRTPTAKTSCSRSQS